MFQSEGQHKVKIVEATLCISPYDKSEQELAVGLLGQSIDDPAQQDWWYGILSEEYGIGNYADKKRWETTIDDLKKHLDWAHGKNINDETLKDMLGKQTEFGVKAREYNGKTYYDVKYLGIPSWGPKRVSTTDVEDKLKKLFGSTATSASASAKPKPAPAKLEDAEVVNENPFG